MDYYDEAERPGAIDYFEEEEDLDGAEAGFWKGYVSA